MGFTSQDDLINQITTNGKGDNVIYQKTTSVAGVAGSWTDLGVFPGTVPLSTYGGTNMQFTATDDTWSEGVIYHGGDVSTATKHFTSVGATVVAAAGAPWFLQCVDQIGYVKVGTLTVGTQTITMTAIGNSVAKVDRYPNGEGLRLYMSNGATSAMGANAPTVVINYLNTSGASKSTTSFTSTASAVAGYVLNSGAGVTNKYAPFIPLAANDTGVSDIVSITWGGTAHASGTPIIHLVKPLWTLPIPASGLYSVMDFLNTLPSLPRIRDGACLRFMLFQTGATTTSTPIMLDFNHAYGG